MEPSRSFVVSLNNVGEIRPPRRSVAGATLASTNLHRFATSQPQNSGRHRYGSANCNDHVAHRHDRPRRRRSTSSGNNVANANTVGFKESSVSFATQFLQTHSIGSAPTGSQRRHQPAAGGPRRQGGRDHARLYAGHDRDQLEPARPGDPGRRLLHRRRLAGRAALHAQRTVQDEREQRDRHDHGPARVGLLASTTNFEIQPTELAPLEIPLGAAAVAQATENVAIIGDLDPNAVVGTIPQVIQSAILSDGRREVPDGERR